MWPVWLRRMRRFRELLDETGLVECCCIVEPRRASVEDLVLVHSRNLIELLERASRVEGTTVIDYGDTIGYSGLLDDVLLVVGATLTCLELVLKKKFDHAYQPYGGLHHATRDKPAGFCPANDVAIAVEKALRMGCRKVMVVDIDVHHADGTQEIFYGRSDVLTISFHMKEPGFYPGTGGVEELGSGEGYGYSVNVPLPRGTGDDAFLWAFENLVPTLLKGYGPDLVIAQMGVDGHKLDYLGGLNLSLNAYYKASRLLHDLCHEHGVPLLALGGGGYGEMSAEAMIACVSGLASPLPEDVEARVNELLSRDSATTSPPWIWERVKKALEYLRENIPWLR